MTISEAQWDNIGHIEITTSVVSIIATLSFIAAFIRFPKLRSPSNTLMLYASFANLLGNTATMMGRGHSANNRGAKCQTQAFLIQWLLQADPLWSLAMAINVSLCIFWRYDAARLKRLYWMYAVACYGLPFIAAVFCLLYREHGKGHIYGNAQLWCWISNEYKDVRIWAFYLPIWVSIFIALAIYARVGVVVWKVHRDLQALSQNHGSLTSTSESQDSQAVLLHGDEKVDYTRASLAWSPPPSPGMPKIADAHASDDIQPPTPQFRTSRYDSIDAMMLVPPQQSPRLVDASFGNHDNPDWKRHRAAQLSTSSQGSACFCSPLDPVHSHTEPPPPRPVITRLQSSNQVGGERKTSTSSQKLQWAYAKSSLLFMTSILLTWIPPSINRARTLTHPDIAPSYPLLAMSATVLPLQGFWNAVIFVVGSWGVIKGGWSVWKEERGERRKERQGKKELC